MRRALPTTDALAATASRWRDQRGFTIAEMVVSLAILVLVLVGVLQVFDLASHVARVQTEVADMQQSLRGAQYDMVHLVRMAGRGNLPAEVAQPAPPAAAPPFSMPQGLAVSVANNVPANTFVDAPARNYPVLRGTDVLTIRGVLTTPVYTVAPTTFDVDKSVGSPTYGTGHFTINSQARPDVPVPQDLKFLADAIRNNRPEALILISPLDDSIYQVVELDTRNCVADDLNNPTTIRLAFKFSGGTNTTAYLALSGGSWNATMTDVAYAGILEEYRYYVSDTREPDQPNGTAAPRPKLQRAQLYPGTQSPWNGQAANWAVTEADGVTDIQVALGIETGSGSPFMPEEGTDDASRATDEWLYNSPADDPTDPHWRTGKLAYVRLTTTAYTQRRDKDYRAAPNVTTEDHVYTIPDPGSPLGTQTPDRSFRRRNLRTVIDLRNVT
jgi:prepilin-type N-terminal cleavage/methylation domain-containing protein